ncbi:MAG: penicillin-binding protein 1C, partial [Pseudomonadota bacterium]
GAAIRGAAIRGALLLAATLLLAALLYGAAAIFGLGADPPQFAVVRANWHSSQAWLLDRDGTPLQSRRMDMTAQRGDWVTLDEVSPALRQAVLQIEDARYYTHRGVDLRALGSAVLSQAGSAGGRGGASTITMQLVSLLPGTAAGTARRDGRRGLAAKWRQMRAAWQLERRWSKAQIFEAYLNHVGYRGELVGLGAAAQGLFGKAPSGLSKEEALLLATLIGAPRAAPERVVARACRLSRLREIAANCETLAAVAAPALTRTPLLPQSPDLAPQLGRSLLQSAGQRVATTLSLPLQRAAHDILRRQLQSLGESNVRDGAVVVVDNASGDVLAYVGSAGPDSTAAQVDGARALRQAGSTLKPFLYAQAFGARLLTPVSLLDDSPLNLDTGVGLYVPQNYDREFKGIVSARTALAASLNIPAIRTLQLVGITTFRDLLQSLGYSDLRADADYYGFSLALGSAEVSLRQQVNAFRTLAQGGMASPLRWLAGQPRITPQRVLDAGATFLVTDILSDAAARSATFGFDSPLATPFWTAVKTGTSKDLRDNWCIGFSQRYTVGVWVGNFEGDSMRDVSGVTGAAPVWLEVMQWLHAGTPSRAPPAPQDVIAADVLFAPAVEPARRSWFLAGTQMSRVELLSASVQPRLMSPAAGSTIARDPDIPASVQRVILQAGGATARHSLVLDGRRLGAASQALRWVPQPGAHRLELQDAAGKVLDKVDFTVRP